MDFFLNFHAKHQKSRCVSIRNTKTYQVFGVLEDGLLEEIQEIHRDFWVLQ